MRRVSFRTVSAFVLAVSIRPLVAVAALALIVPSVMAQAKAGVLIVENNTGVEVRVGCEDYVDSDGNRVKLASYWTLAPGANVKLLAPPAPGAAAGKEIVAREFFFCVITTDGETNGWSFKQVNAAGELRFQLDASSLGSHRKLVAANRQNPQLRVSLYPPLQAQPMLIQQAPPQGGNAGLRQQMDTDISNTEFAVSQGEQKVRELNNNILGARAALLVANLAYEKADTDFKRLVSGGAVLVAQRALDEFTANRTSAESTLRADRDRLSRLRSDRQALGN